MRIFFVLLVSLLWTGQALACLSPQFEDHHYPSCTTPLPSVQDRVVYIHTNAVTALSDHHVGAPNAETRVISIEVAPNKDAHFIVLGASEQTIWDFNGDVDSISQVIVLGSTRFGPHVAGVMGLPEHKVAFTDPDLSLMDNILRTSCTRISKACSGNQLFGNGSTQQITYYPEPAQPAIRLDVEITSPSMDLDEPIKIVPPAEQTKLIAIDPTQVVSTNPVLPYGKLPGQPGLDALVADGSLIAINRATDHPLVQAYSEAFSAKYRSRFDPDFTFTPKIDYIITGATVLPPELRPTSFLTALGVPAPNMNGNHGFTACYFVSDQSDEALDTSMVSSPLCRHNSISRAVPDDDQETLQSASRFDRAPLGNPACAIAALPDETHVAVLALHDNGFGRYRDDPPGIVNISVVRDGPVALFVATTPGKTHFNIIGDQLSHIFTDRPFLATATLNGTPIEVAGLYNKADGCPNFAPYRADSLGPAIAHLDALFVDLTGQAIDELITGAAWTHPNAPPLTFVIDN